MNILITGARGGIGHDAAFALARRGHAVWATTRTQVQADELAQEADRLNLSIKTMKLDILDADDRDAAAQLAPDVLVNNAAIGESGPIAQIPLKYVRENFETNIFATMALTQLIVKRMKKKGQGKIINISSVAGKITLPYLGVYSMTKHALEAMSDALRQELRPHNVHVSVVEPGAIATGFNERMNATKYKWLKASKKVNTEDIKKYESMLVHDQARTNSVVQAIVHAAEANKPKAVYVRPRSMVLLTWLSQILPPRWVDWIIRRKI